MSDDDEVLRDTARELFRPYRPRRWELSPMTHEGREVVTTSAPAEEAEPEPVPDPRSRNVVPNEGLGGGGAPTPPDDTAQDLARSLFGRDSLGRAPYRWPGE